MHAPVETRFPVAGAMAGLAHPELGQLLPVVRWSDHFSLFGLQRRDFLIVREDRLLGGRVSTDFAMPEELFDDRALGWLRERTGQITKPLNIALDEIERIAVSVSTLTDGYRRDRKSAVLRIEIREGSPQKIELPLVEAIFVLQALDRLIGSRLDADDAVFAALQKRADQIEARAEALTRANREKAGTSPTRSPVLGTVNMVIGAVLLTGWPLLAMFENWIPLLAAIFLGVPFGAGLFNLGRAMRAPAYDDVMTRDDRPPVVYLRSFGSEDVQVPEKPPGVMGRIILRLGDRAWFFAMPGAIIAWLARLAYTVAGRGSNRLEEQLARGVASAGPMIAVGRPGEDVATLGAVRAYLADEDWQQFVIDLLERAQLVLLQIESTEGTWWEFSECVRIVPPERLVLMLTARFGSQQRYDEMRILAKETLGLTLPRSIGDAAFLYFDADGTAHGAPMAWYSFLTAWARPGHVNIRGSLAPVLARLGA